MLVTCGFPGFLLMSMYVLWPNVTCRVNSCRVPGIYLMTIMTLTRIKQLLKINNDKR